MLSIDYSTYRSVVVRLFLGDQSVVITKDLSLFLWGGGQVCSRWFRVRLWTLGLRCDLSELVSLRVYGLGSPRACRCCGTEEWSGGIDFSGNPSYCRRRGCRASVLEPRNKSLVFVIALALSLSLSLVYILHASIVFIFTCLIFLLCLIDIFAWDCLLTLVFNQESQRGTSTHSRGI